MKLLSIYYPYDVPLSSWSGTSIPRRPLHHVLRRRFSASALYKSTFYLLTYYITAVKPGTHYPFERAVQTGGVYRQPSRQLNIFHF